MEDRIHFLKGIMNILVLYIKLLIFINKYTTIN